MIRKTIATANSTMFTTTILKIITIHININLKNNVLFAIKQNKTITQMYVS